MRNFLGIDILQTYQAQGQDADQNFSGNRYSLDLSSPGGRTQMKTFLGIDIMERLINPGGQDADENFSGKDILQTYQARGQDANEKFSGNRCHGETYQAPGEGGVGCILELFWEQMSWRDLSSPGGRGGRTQMRTFL